MSKLDDIRAAIATRIESVNGIGLVHDYERFAKAEKEFKQLYASGTGADTQILGWYVRRINFTQEKINNRIVIINRWRITGFMSLSDANATEKKFDALIEALTEVFRADVNLGGVVFGLNDGGDKSGLQLDDSGPLMFAGALCHGARLSLSTIHIHQGA